MQRALYNPSGGQMLYFHFFTSIFSVHESELHIVLIDVHTF